LTTFAGTKAGTLGLPWGIVEADILA